MADFKGVEERRRVPRFNLSVPVEYRKLREPASTKKGSLIKDISLGGVRFETDEFLAFTARLVLDISLPLPERSVSVVSKIAWIRKLPQPDCYEVGNQFLEMSKETKDRLSGYLNKLSGTAKTI